MRPTKKDMKYLNRYAQMLATVLESVSDYELRQTIDAMERLRAGDGYERHLAAELHVSAVREAKIREMHHIVVT